VASAPVVDPFDPVADGELSGRASGPQVSVVELDFQCCPEGFGRSVIPAHPGTTDRARQVVPVGEPGQLPGGVLTAGVSVQDHLLSQLAAHRDGHRQRRLDEVGVRYLIVSMETNVIVGARAKKLEVDCVQGVDDKLSVVRDRAVDLGVSLEDTAFLGNDINDAECLRAVGVPVVPADAWPEVKPLAHWVLSRPGGSGCVREFCDAVWEAQR